MLTAVLKAVKDAVYKDTRAMCCSPTKTRQHTDLFMSKPRVISLRGGVIASPLPKVDEGFLLVYESNEHAYSVFNKASGKVEIVVDVTFDESNGSQVE
jgi:hypothetical protein